MREHDSRRLKVFDKLKLGARLGTVRVALALFDCFPEGGDDPQRLLATLGVRGLDQPATDHHAGPADAASAVDGAHPAAALVVPEDVEDGEHEFAGLGEGAVLDWELVVLDLGERDRVGACKGGEVWGVGGELAGLGEVNEGAHTCSEDFVELLGGGFEWRPGVLAGEEAGGGPVRVGDGSGRVDVEWEGRATLGAGRLVGAGGEGVDGCHVFREVLGGDDGSGRGSERI